LKLVLAIIVGILIGAGALLAFGPSFGLTPFGRPLAEVRTPAPPILPTPSAGGTPIPGGGSGSASLTAGDAPVRVYEAVSSSVVNINTTGRGRDALGRSFQQQGTGSGFIIDQEGHIATNQHVVSGATRLDITLADGSSYLGTVLASDNANDLTLVKLEAPDDKLRSLTPVKLGDSSILKVGQTVVAIGNPFGLERSASLGIISSLGRTRPGVDQRLITNMIQTDAAINPGNSGGPLLNLQGEVIGINEQIEVSSSGVGSGGNIGVGFAIPVNTLKRFLPDLLAGREPKHAWLGIAGRALSPSVAEDLRMSGQRGVMLVSVSANGPAAQGGLRGSTRTDTNGDIITEIDGHSVRSVEDIAQYIDGKEPGDIVKVAFVRGSQTQTTDVTLGTWDSNTSAAR
jgi:2-alkenal reductase